MPAPLDTSIKDQVEQMLRAGRPPSEIRDTLGVSTSTISNIRRERGIEGVDSQTLRNAREAKARYDLEGRRELGNELFDKIRDALNTPNLTLRDLKEGALAYGILVDKFRLEDGEATGRHEQRYSRELNLEEEFKRLDQQLVEEAKQSPAGEDGAEEGSG